MNKQNKITLDKAKRYNISELNEEQIEQIAKATGDCPTEFLSINKHMVLYYDEQWLLDAFNFNFLVDETEETINAKTLFK